MMKEKSSIFNVLGSLVSSSGGAFSASKEPSPPFKLILSVKEKSSIFNVLGSLVSSSG